MLRDGEFSNGRIRLALAGRSSHLADLVGALFRFFCRLLFGSESSSSSSPWSSSPESPLLSICR